MHAGWSVVGGFKTDASIARAGMLAFPYAHEDARRVAPKATIALMAAWCVAFLAMAALDAPIQTERAFLCGEATHLVVTHPGLARDAPDWPDCDLPRYVAGAGSLQRRGPSEGSAPLRAALLTKAARAEDLRRQLSRDRFAHSAARPSLLTPLTALLLHPGLAALAASLLCLWLIGPAIELRLVAPALPLLFLGGGALGVMAGVGAAGSDPLVGGGVALAAPLAAGIIAAPRGRAQVFWCYWWFRGGRLSVPVAPVAVSVWLLASPAQGAGVSSLALLCPPVLLGALTGALLRRRGPSVSIPEEVAEDTAEDAVGSAETEMDLDTAATTHAAKAAEPAALELPDAPDLDERPRARLVTRRGRTITGDPSTEGRQARRMPRLRLRRGRMISLRDDRAILGIGTAVVEQRWDEVRWIASAISGESGPVLDLIVSWHETPKGPVASGFRVVASETDFDALFNLPEGTALDERFKVLAQTVRSLASSAWRLPDDYTFLRPLGYPDEQALDQALVEDLAREARRRT